MPNAGQAQSLLVKAMATAPDHDDLDHHHGPDHHDDSDPSVHPDDPIKASEHEALLKLVPVDKATHIAIRDGNWNDPQTWKNGKIPTLGADVLISEGIEVTYNVDSNTPIQTMRVDGHLKFATDTNTHLLIDTFVVAPTGKLIVGEKGDPIQSTKKARISFIGSKPIDKTWDPTQLSRGLISHGSVEIHGAEKQEYVALAQPALQGDRELVLDLPTGSTTPLGWKVGDQIVLSGTRYNPNGKNADNSKFQDEVLTITRINGNRVQFINHNAQGTGSDRLRFDHAPPNTGVQDQLNVYVANLSRNVVFETANADRVPTQQRGHVMFMHSDDVVVENAGFYNLGRTDKSRLVDDVGKNVNGTIGKGTNVRGRYSLHIHRAGLENPTGSGVILKGNVVNGSPGWGIVQHESNAQVLENVVFDVAGAGIVAESGNEIGWWRQNLTIKTTGDGLLTMRPAQLNRVRQFDLASSGEGYWVQGAGQIAMEGNKAVSAAGAGINIFSTTFGLDPVRPVNTIDIESLPEKFHSLAQPGMTDIAVENLPLRLMRGFEVYNAAQGIIFWQHMGNNDGQLGFNAPNLDPAHNYRTKVRDFKIWGVLDRGVHYQYSTQVDLRNGIIIGNPGSSKGFGISSNGPAQDLRFRKLWVEGFAEGLALPREGRLTESVTFLGSRIEESVFLNNTRHLSERLSFQGEKGAIPLFSDYFQILNTKFDSTTPNRLPTAGMSVKSLGGLAVRFDASASQDIDVPLSQKNSKQAIAAYGWDFNSDGIIDEFGRLVNHRFSRAGTYNVSLTVWDTQGASQTLKQSLKVAESAYPNLLYDSSFDAKAARFEGDSKFQGSTGAGFGWLTSGWKVDPSLGDGGAAVAQESRKGMAQVIYDDFARVGQHQLRLNYKSIDADRIANQLMVRVWGVNGEFDAGGWRVIDDGPLAVGRLPMTKKALLNTTITPGSSNQFNPLKWNIDLGSNGYQYLVVQFNTLGVNAAAGDVMALDNVALVGANYTGPIISASATATEVNSGNLLERQPINSTGLASGGAALSSVSHAGSSQNSSAASLVADSGSSLPINNSKDRLVGTSAGDMLHGSDSRDLLIGRRGNDVVNGGGLADFLRGGKGHDLLKGGTGHDLIKGGAGADRFRWMNQTEMGDRIIDFKPGHDRLEFNRNQFDRALAAGGLDPSAFTLGSKAQDASDRFIYNTVSGQLWFDQDGTGAQAAKLVLTLQPNLGLTASSIHLVG
jgi:PKD repeat protein